MSQVGSNKVVKLAFALEEVGGGPLDSADEKDPLVYLHGVGMLPVGIENLMNGMKAGDKKDARLEPKDAFGVRDDAKVEKIGRHHLGKGSKVRKGDMVRLETKDGVRDALVVAMTPVSVTLDFNHPLAGKTIDVKLHVVDLRDATAEEKEHGHAHGWDPSHGHGGHDHDHDHEGHDHDHDHGGHDHDHDHGGHDHDHDHAAHDHSHDHAGHDHDHDHAGHDHSHGHGKHK